MILYLLIGCLLGGVVVLLIERLRSRIEVKVVSKCAEHYGEARYFDGYRDAITGQRNATGR